MTDDPASDAVAAIGVLAEPTRLALYRFVVAQPAPVSREQAAAAVGVAPHAARFHLDRLHRAGLLDVGYERPPGRGGPGAGHPTKLYRAAATEVTVSVPDRRYDLAGLVLSRAVAGAMGDGTPVAEALEQAATEAGRDIGRRIGPPSSPRRPLAAVIDALDAHGFSPRVEGAGYVLGNCPFRALAQEQPEVVCSMNVALVNGLLGELGVADVRAHLEPADGRCCVAVHA